MTCAACGAARTVGGFCETCGTLHRIATTASLPRTLHVRSVAFLATGGVLFAVVSIMHWTTPLAPATVIARAAMASLAIVLILTGFGMRHAAPWSRWVVRRTSRTDPEVAAAFDAPAACPTCGRPVATDQAFCPACGAGIRPKDPPLGTQVRASFARFFRRQAPEPPRAQAFHQGVQRRESHRFLWVSLVAIALGFLSFFGGAPVQSLGITALVVVPPLLLLFWLREQDRHEREPIGLLLAAFAWGILCGPLVFPLNALAHGLTMDPATGRSWLLFSQAGPIEEAAKALFVFALATHTVYRRELNGAVDGLVYGACVGLGFAAAENFYYIYDRFGGGEETAIIFPGFLVRFSGNLLHALWAGFAGGYLGLMLLRHGRITWRNFVAAVIPSALIHSFNNVSNFLVPGLAGVFLDALIMGVSAFAFFKLLAEGQRDETAWGIGRADKPVPPRAFEPDPT